MKRFLIILIGLLLFGSLWTGGEVFAKGGPYTPPPSLPSSSVDPVAPLPKKPIAPLESPEPNITPPTPSAGGEGAGGADDECVKGKDIMLNTDIPFVGRCIKKDVTATIGGQTTLASAFPKLMGGLIRVVMAAVVIVGFLAILVGGFMVAAEGAAQTKQKGLQLIKLAIAGLILVGLSGVILNLINPNFFKTTTGLIMSLV